MGCACYGGRHHVVRWILGLILLGFVFCAGLALGELKGFLGQMRYGRYGSSHYPVMMRGYGGYGSMMGVRGGYGPVNFPNGGPTSTAPQQ